MKLTLISYLLFVAACHATPSAQTPKESPAPVDSSAKEPVSAPAAAEAVSSESLPTGAAAEVTPDVAPPAAPAMPDFFVAAASDPNAAAAMINGTKGVPLVQYNERLSDEQPNITKTAKLLCSGESLQATFAQAMNAATLAGGSCDGEPMTCIVAGTHDSPTYRFYFAKDGNKLSAIEVMGDSLMSAAGRAKAQTYVAAQRKALAKKHCK